MTYITPDRFRVMGFGVDLGDLEDADFAFLLARASSLVDTYCNVPMLPSAHDFRGGTIVKEKHRWRLADMTMPTSDVGTRRVYPLHYPIRNVTSFVVKFSNTYQVTIAPGDLYINETESWAEVISLAAVVTGVYPVGVNFGLYTPVAEVGYTYGWTFDSTGEVLLPDDGFTFRASNQFWSADTTPAISVNGAVVTTGYTVNSYEGTVVFDTLQPADAVVRATYSYTLPPPIRDATAFIAADLLGDRELHQRGMGHLGMVRIAEMELRREDSFGRGSAVALTNSIPIEAQQMLAPYRYITVR